METKFNSRIDEVGEAKLSEGDHLGFHWLTSHNNLGFRCGYIRLPETHPWSGKNYDDIPADVHGGLTFAGLYADGYWIGFDCAHRGDAPDKTLPGRILDGWGVGQTRSQAYVESESKQLCEQAAQAATRKE